MWDSTAVQKNLKPKYSSTYADLKQSQARHGSQISQLHRAMRNQFWAISMIANNIENSDMCSIATVTFSNVSEIVKVSIYQSQ
jgi:hypothetical protein